MDMRILGFGSAPRKTAPPALAFFRSLVVRGLTGVIWVTSDARPGLVTTIHATLPGASWQRCRTHSLPAYQGAQANQLG
jgi:putative transposase